MRSAPVSLLVRLRIKPEHADEVAAMLAAAAEPTRREPGNLAFEAARSLFDPTVMILHEVWATQPDLDRHNATPEMAQRMTRYAAILAEPPEITPLARLSD